MKRIKSTFPRNRNRRYQAYLIAMLKQYHAYISTVILPKLRDINPVNTDAGDLVLWGAQLQLVLGLMESWSTDRETLDQRRVTEEGALIAAFVSGQYSSELELLLTQRPEVEATGRSIGITGSRGQARNQGIINAWATENVKLITKMRDDEREAIAGIVTRGFSQGLSMRDIEKDIRKQFNLSRNRAALIARNETGNLAGALNKAENERLGIELYEWLDSSDARVRPSHRKMDGKICRWDDPTVYKDSVEDTVWKSRSSIGGVEKHPGMDIRCRCTSASIIEI